MKPVTAKCILIYDPDIGVYEEIPVKDLEFAKKCGWKVADSSEDWRVYLGRNRQYTCAEI